MHDSHEILLGVECLVGCAIIKPYNTLVSSDRRVRAAQFKNLARRNFDRWAGRYDRSILHYFLFRPAYLSVLEEIAKWLGRRAESIRLLDIGSGTGELAQIVSQTGWPIDYLGLDYSWEMCLEATRKCDEPTERIDAVFAQGDSEHLPLMDACCDVVVCANSFHHYPHQRAVICEMRRVLAPGGRLILIDGFRDNAIGWFVFDVVIAKLEQAVYHAPWHEIHEHCESAGFSRIARRKINLLLPLLITIADV